MVTTNETERPTLQDLYDADWLYAGAMHLMGEDGMHPDEQNDEAWERCRRAYMLVNPEADEAPDHWFSPPEPRPRSWYEVEETYSAWGPYEVAIEGREEIKRLMAARSER